jgi:hypothetical protein
MKSQHYKRDKRYDIINLVFKFLTLGIAITALIIALQAKRDIKWIENIQDNVIERLMFPS